MEEDYDYPDDNETYEYGDYHSLCDKESVRHFGSLFLPAIYAAVLMVGLSGNGLVVVVYASPRRLRTLTDACILNLAVSDLLLLFTLPFWAADAVHGWRLGDAACKLASFLYSANFSCAMLLMACISADRYRAVARCAAGRAAQPGRSSRKRWRLAAVVAAVWAAAVLLGVPDLVLSRVKHTSHGPTCLPVYPAHMALAAKASLELLEVGLRFLLPFLVMAVCYTKVGRALRSAPGVRRDRKWRAVRVLLAVLGVFLLTQLPYSVVKMVRAADALYALVSDCGASMRLDRALQLTESLALCHACANPVLYAFVGSSFRGHVMRAAKRLGHRLGAGRAGGGRGAREPAVEMALHGPPRVPSPSPSTSDNMDTSTFTI